MQTKYKEDQFKGLDLNTSHKCKQGFISIMLHALYDRCSHAVATMGKPRGFHLLLCNAVKANAHEMPRVISRWAVKRARSSNSYMTGSYHFIKAEEIRPRTGEFHIHLYIIADRVSYDDVVFLKEALCIIAPTVELKYRDEECRPFVIDESTGEILLDSKTGKPKRKGSPRYHDLKDELPDFFKRASYICKVNSKVSLSSWSCNKLIKPNQPQVVRVHQKIAEQCVKVRPNADFIQFNQPFDSFSQLQSSLICNQKPTEMQSNVSEFRHEIDQKKIQ